LGGPPSCLSGCRRPIRLAGSALDTAKAAAVYLTTVDYLHVHQNSVTLLPDGKRADQRGGGDLDTIWRLIG